MTPTLLQIRPIAESWLAIVAADKRSRVLRGLRPRFVFESPAAELRR